MRMIKAVIFDFGNVIASFDDSIFLRPVSEQTGKSVEELLGIYRPVLNTEFETGHISAEEFYERFKTASGHSMCLEEFRDLYCSIFTEVPRMLELVKRLKGNNYRLVLLSNTNPWHYEHPGRDYESVRLMDALSLSFEVGHVKPDCEIFEDAVRKAGCEPNECVYIDDIKEYADKATELGMHGVQYVEYENLLRELRSLGVKVD